MMEDAWKAHAEHAIRTAHQRFIEAPDYVERCTTAAQHGYRPATLAERLYADPTRLYTGNGGLWCQEE